MASTAGYINIEPYGIFAETTSIIEPKLYTEWSFTKLVFFIWIRYYKMFTTAVVIVLKMLKMLLIYTCSISPCWHAEII
jgi:hypothetical protein